MKAAAFPNFTYSYLGRNVRPLKEKFAALYEPSFCELPQAQGSGLAGRRRIGIVVTQRHEGIFLRCMTGVLRGLSQDLFELVVLCSIPSIKPLREGLQIPHLRFVSFGPAIANAASKIREARCDVLYFWEAGSDSLNYFLPLLPPGAAFYRKMGLGELVTRTVEEYASLAARLGTDRGYREQVTGQIRQSSGKLFDDRQAVTDHQRFFAELAGL